MNEGSYLTGKPLTIVEQKGVYQVLYILNTRLFHIFLQNDYSCFTRIVRSMIKDIRTIEMTHNHAILILPESIAI